MFQGCTSLTNITIPSTVTVIDYFAFSGCEGLTNITIPDSVTTMNSFAFENCSGLISIKIGRGLRNIDVGMFNNCINLESVCVTRPPSMNITGLDWYVFENCSALSVIYVPDPVSLAAYKVAPRWSDFQTLFKDFSTDLSFIYDSATDSYFVTGGASAASEIYIPAMHNGKYVTKISNSAFSYLLNLISVIFEPGNRLQSIGNDAFNNCISLTSITIPNSVTSIGSGAFSDCYELTEIYIPISVTFIGGYAFELSDYVTIYAQAPSMPSGWDSGWNNNGCPVVWGVFMQ